MLAAALLLSGCYGQLSAPDVAEPPPAEPTPSRPVPPSVAGTGAAGGALADLAPILTKLATDQAEPSKRPGSAVWRTGELQKLQELTLQLCGAGGPPCHRALSDISASAMPGDELLPLLGTFMGPLRPYAEIGFATLGRVLLTAPSGHTRDIAFRMAVGAGVTRRGDPDAESRRATLVPQSPAAGEPAVLLVEIKAICNEVRATVKGPDDRGRLDVELEPDCAGLPEPELGPDGLPRAIRAVWSQQLEAVTEFGTSVWIVGSEQPLLTYRPVLGPAAPTTK
jgi:hypothetical protein